MENWNIGKGNEWENTQSVPSMNPVPKENIKLCRSCVLPDTFPGARLDSEGVCHYCRQYEKEREGHRENRREYLQKFMALAERIKKSSRSGYDVLVAYSGGKDSTYTLRLLKEKFGLNPLALTFDHGFVSPQALRNIETAAAALGVDRLLISPDPGRLRQAFANSVRKKVYSIKALERASAICNTCMHLAKSLLLKTAVEMGIPLIAYGWSPGQAPLQSSVMRWNLSLVKSGQNTLRNILKEVMNESSAVFLLDERHYLLIEQETTRLNGDFLYNVHPLAFLDYDEKVILRSIREIGWNDPRDTDANSTNCLLNGYANKVHLEQCGFHPYASETAALVRLGAMTREEGLRKLNEPGDEEIIGAVRKKLEQGAQSREQRA
jgi:tRNA(Ile)-lysidine synthase TilS/MesJ